MKNLGILCEKYVNIRKSIIKYISISKHSCVAATIKYIKYNAWVTVNNDFLSRVGRLTSDKNRYSR